ncbi:MAG: hypothetical protein HC892_23380 [Saprospiraceae bacterium]|nr:hypothetical protein [Saprospiraceae bacterium]
MQKIEITSMSVSDIEALLKSKEDYKIALRLCSILPIAKGESSECPAEDVFLFEDECSMSNTADVSYKWGEKGKQPLIEQKQYKRERLTLLGAVNPISGEVIIQQAERGNAITFKKYLKKVIKIL